MIYLDIFLGMQEERVRYLVVGRLAMNIAQDTQTRPRWQAVRRGERSLLEGLKTSIPFGFYLNGDVLSWYGSPSFVTYQRSPAMTPTPVAIPV